jgi:hypothetical protein
MKNSFKIILISSFLIISFYSCSNSKRDLNVLTTDTIREEKPIKEEEPTLNSDLLGIYNGLQPDYYLKNQFGDDMVVNGNKVSVPSSDFKFILKENNLVSLQQTNQEDNSRYYYDGVVKLLNETNEAIEIECSLSDGNTSSPTYILLINKLDKTAICKGKDEPEFKLTKIK